MGTYTDIEREISKHVHERVSVIFRLHYYNELEKNWKIVIPTILQDNTKYRLKITAKCIAHLDYLKNVQIRVKNENPNIDYYTDESFSTLATNQRCDSVNYPDELGEFEITPWHTVYFRVKNHPSEVAGLANVGIYADIRPRGRKWQLLEGFFD